MNETDVYNQAAMRTAQTQAGVDRYNTAAPTNNTWTMNSGQGNNGAYPKTQTMRPPVTDVYTYNDPMIKQAPPNPNVVVGGGRQSSPYGSRNTGGSFGQGPAATGRAMANTMRNVGNTWKSAATGAMGRMNAIPAFPRSPNQIPRVGPDMFNKMRGYARQRYGGPQTSVPGNRMAMYGNGMAGVAEAQQAAMNQAAQAQQSMMNRARPNVYGQGAPGLLNRLRG